LLVVDKMGFLSFGCRLLGLSCPKNSVGSSKIQRNFQPGNAIRIRARGAFLAVHWGLTNDMAGAKFSRLRTLWVEC